jgi:outer membrane PBP1 activator LpoA protein
MDSKNNQWYKSLGQTDQLLYRILKRLEDSAKQQEQLLEVMQSLATKQAGTAEDWIPEDPSEAPVIQSSSQTKQKREGPRAESAARKFKLM